MTSNMNIFTIYQTLLSNVMRSLPKIYRNNIKASGKVSSSWFIFKERDVVLTMHMVSGVDFWQN